MGSALIIERSSRIERFYSTKRSEGRKKSPNVKTRTLRICGRASIRNGVSVGSQRSPVSVEPRNVVWHDERLIARSTGVLFPEGVMYLTERRGEELALTA